VFVDIKDVLDRKLELLKLHASQVDKTMVENLTILESVRSCANFRGYQGRVKYAEGFKALRILKDI
jgi:LmbE family N-acetylglucosaminyl deacetylase